MNKVDQSRLEFTVNKWLTLEKPGLDIAVEVPAHGDEWPGQYIVGHMISCYLI